MRSSLGALPRKYPKTHVARAAFGRYITPFLCLTSYCTTRASVEGDIRFVPKQVKVWLNMVCALPSTRVVSVHHGDGRRSFSIQADDVLALREIVRRIILRSISRRALVRAYRFDRRVYTVGNMKSLEVLFAVFRIAVRLRR